MACDFGFEVFSSQFGNIYYIGSIWCTYSPWLINIEWSSRCSMFSPVNLNLRNSLFPNGSFCWTCSRAWLNLWLPPRIPSSTCVPKIRSRSAGLLLFLRRNKQLSKGCASKPSALSKLFVEQKWSINTTVSVAFQQQNMFFWQIKQLLELWYRIDC